MWGTKLQSTNRVYSLSLPTRRLVVVGESEVWPKSMINEQSLLFVPPDPGGLVVVGESDANIDHTKDGENKGLHSANKKP